LVAAEAGEHEKRGPALRRVVRVQHAGKLEPIGREGNMFFHGAHCNPPDPPGRPAVAASALVSYTSAPWPPKTSSSKSSASVSRRVASKIRGSSRARDAIRTT